MRGETANKSETILITGGTGFIGDHLLPELIKSGFKLRIITRSSKNMASSDPSCTQVVEYVTLPTTDEEFDQALSGVRHVINLAGASIFGGRWTDETKDFIRSSRIKLTSQLSAAIARCRPGSVNTFLSGSAIGFYPCSAEETFDEHSPLGRGFLAEVCRDWELATNAAAAQAKVFHLRTGLVLGHGGGMMAQVYPLLTKGMATVLGSGEQWVSWIHVTDVVRAIVYLLENHQRLNPGPYNLVSPHPVRHGELMHQLSADVGKLLKLRVPESALKWTLGEAASPILNSQRIVPTNLQSSGFKFMYERIELASKSLCQPAGSAGAQVKRFWQWVPQSRAEVFAYFCDEKNLEHLTPDSLKFHVLRKSTPEVQEGTLIDYQLRIHGVPASWQTEIKSWNPPEQFIDVQLKGPYAFWHHTHSFVEVRAGGTLMEDTILYKIPLGILGQLTGGGLVSNDIDKIFSYRRRRIEELFAASSIAL